MGAIQTAHGTDVDDIAFLLWNHVLQNHLRKQDLAVQVSTGRILQLLTGGICQGGQIPAVNRVVDQNVDLAVLIIHSLGKILDGIVVVQIQRHADGIIALLTKLGCVFLALLAIAGGDDNGSAHFTQAQRNGVAVQSTAAGNNGYTAIQAEQIFGMSHNFNSFYLRKLYLAAPVSSS